MNKLVEALNVVALTEDRTWPPRGQVGTVVEVRGFRVEFSNDEKLVYACSP